MKKLILTVALSLFVAGGLLLAPTASAHFIGVQHMHDKKDPNIFWLMPQTAQTDSEYHDWYKNNPYHHKSFDHYTDYYDDYFVDKHTNRKIYYVNDPNDYCDWEYNSNSGSWVCEKGTSYYEADYGCPYGYIRHEDRNECIAIHIPANAHLNANGDGWECNSGYKINYRKDSCKKRIQDVYVYDAFSSDGFAYANNSIDNYRTLNAVSSEYVYPYKATSPSRLPTTGTGLEWVLFAGALGTYGVFRRKK